MTDNNHPPKPFTSEVHADIDFMDIDQVMVVPDTPDRISKQPKSICKMSTYDDSRSRRDNRAIRDRSRLFGDSIHSAGLYSHPEGNIDDSAQKQGASSSAVPSSSSRHVLVSSVLDDKIYKHMDRHHYTDQERKNDRVSHSSFDGIPHHRHHHHRIKNPVLVKHEDTAKFCPKSKQDDSRVRKTGKVHPNPSDTASLNTAVASKSTKNDNNRRMKVKVDHDYRANCNAMPMKRSDSICLITSDHDNVSSYSTNDNKGKVDHDDLVHSNALSVKENVNVCSIGAAQVTEKGASHSLRVPSNINRKRLVRNGCISPHNIAKAKRREDTPGIVVENAEGVAASGSSHPIVDLNVATSKQNAACRAKGKGLLIDDSSSMGHASRKIDAGNSTNERNKGKFLEDCIIVTETRGNSNKNGLGRRNISLFPSTSSPNKSMHSEVQFCTPNASFRRSKKISGSAEKNTEVICLSSGGKSTTMKPSRDHGPPERELGSSSAHVDFRAEDRESISQIDNNSEAREIQLQADEMLARELQEQLYNETPMFTSDERVSSLGGGEQQEDDLHSTFSIRLQEALDSVVNRPSLQAQAPQPLRVPAPQQALRARLFRRGSQAQLPRSNLSRIRSQFYHSRGRPSHMDIEMRMQLLESLEAVYNEDITMVTQLLNSDREFGENDYEMLLALDENNHTHLGASAAQIANLPVSTVNNDNCEICSICLETPVIGDTVRHLPCLHKFHRDCIDPWLRRKRSCPVCKSDI